MNDVWNTVFSKPFSAKGGDSTIWGMAEFLGELYVGAGQSSPTKSANVYRLTHDGCKKWEKVTPPWSSATGGSGMAMAVFKNQLYVATDYGEVWRAADGENWSNTTGNLPSVGKIDATVEFKGYLYISTGTAIWRTSDGSSWKFVINLSAKDPKIYDICSLEVFNNHLYAGIGLKNPVYVNTPQGKLLVNRKGIQLWRTLDGKGWSKFQEEVEPSDKLGVKFYPEHVHALKAFNGYLYVGEYHGNGLYRTDGTATSWNYIPNAISKGTGSVFRLMKHAGKIYLGASHLASPDTPGVPGAPLLYSSTNGTQWTSVDKSPKLDNDHSSITSLLSHGGKLYVGTENPSKNGSVALLELGPEIVSDQFESNNTFTTATVLKLGSTKTQTSAELTDLTLLDNDIDFFKIEYQSKPENKYFHPFKKELIAGIIVEINPGFLSLLVQEEYCRPLILEIYDSKKKLKRKFNTADTVKFTGPDLYFNDQKLFLVVKNPDGKPPVRYKLSVKLSSWYGTLSQPLYEFQKYTPPWGLPENLPWSWVPKIPPRPGPGPFTYFDLGQLVADSEKYLSEFIEYRSKIEKADLDHNLGQIAHLGEQYDDAERFYKQSLTVFQELEITDREADVLQSLRELHSAQGKTE